ncbi:MobA/MobL family protein [Fusobacterium ulcerans]|uniref:MobA/MobL family protein n=1 Tax=Fusobacterium ulcerans TaxID=861 RepID=UPI0026738A0C|nr:MobA/MobL family protein [Fusobacterium ulcerans]
MAEFRLCYKRGKVGYAKNHAAYILRENDYKPKEDLVFKQSGNMSFIDGNNALAFWEAADQNEGINRNAYRELELNIPNELTHTQAVVLIQKYVKKEIGNDFPYSFAIHESFNENGEKNLHCHLMFSERKLDGIDRELNRFFKKANSKNPELGGAKKDREWKKKERLLGLRKSWEVTANEVLKSHGYEARIDCRSLEDRKNEALQKGEYAKAETLNRPAVNISGKILQKIKVAGYMSLSKTEKTELEKYNKAKEIKAAKERDYAIKQGKIIPTKDELISRIEKIKSLELADGSERLDEAGLKRMTVNILSKGQFNKAIKEMKTVEKKRIVYPFNEELIKEEKEAQKRVMEIADKYTMSDKYIRVLNQLERDYTREKELYNNLLKTKYNINLVYELEKKKIEKNQGNQEKIKSRYDDKPAEELRYRLEELEKQDNSHFAMQMLSNYRIEGLAHNSLRYQKELKELELEKSNASHFGTTEERKEIQDKINKLNIKIEKTDQEYSKITESIFKDDKKFLETLTYVEDTRRAEMKVIQDLLKEKEPQQPLENNLASHFKNIIEFEKLNNSYEYFIKNNENEKYNKSLFKLHNRLDVMEDTYNRSLDEIAKMDFKKIQPVIKEYKVEYQNKVNQDRANIEKYDKGISNMNALLNGKQLKTKEGYTPLELIALNKITKGEYSLGYKEKEILKKEIAEHKKELESLGKLSFVRKQTLTKEITEKNILVNKLLVRETELLKKYKGSEFLGDKTKEIKSIYNSSVKKFEKDKMSSTRALNIDKQILYKIKGLEEREVLQKKEKKKVFKGINKIREINRPEGTGNVGVTRELNKLSRFLKSLDNGETGYNNLDIKLEKEGNSWEI